MLGQMFPTECPWGNCHSDKSHQDKFEIKIKWKEGG